LSQKGGVVIGQPQSANLPAVVTPQKRVALLLDETGSMSDIKSDTIGSVNEYFGSLKESGGNLVCTLKTFSSERQRYILKNVPIASVEQPALTARDYVPRAFTPLYDAMGTLIDEMRDGQTGPVLFVVVSDGQENSSKEYDKAKIAARIDGLKGEGWEFVFLGVGWDAYGEAAGLGVGMGSTMSAGRHSNNTRAMYQSTARATRDWATSGSFGYTVEEKRLSGDRAVKSGDS
jgi:hypothetical protein